MEIGFPFLGAWFVFRRSPDRFACHSAYLGIYLLWFWMGSIPILNGDQTLSLMNSFDDRQWLFYLLGFIGYFCGTAVFPRPQAGPEDLRGLQLRWRDAEFLVFLLVVAVAIVVAWGMITSEEGIPIFQSDVDTLRIQISTRHRYAFQLLVVLSNLLLPLMFLYLWSAKAPRFKIPMYVFTLFVIFVFISLGNRGLVLPSLLTIFALRHYLCKPWPAGYVILGGSILVVLLSVTGYYRSLQHFGVTYALDLAELGIPIPLQPFSNIYLYIRAPLDTFRNAVGVIPAITPFQHGFLSVGFVLQILPGHHPSSDYFFKDLLRHTFQGFGEPASILGTFYADFGTAGIVLGMFLTGIMVAAMYRHMYRGSVGWILVYCFFWQKLIGGLYGTLFEYVYELLVPIAWLLIVWSMTAKREAWREGLRQPRTIR